MNRHKITELVHARLEKSALQQICQKINAGQPFDAHFEVRMDGGKISTEVIPNRKDTITVLYSRLTELDHKILTLDEEIQIEDQIARGVKTEDLMLAWPEPKETETVTVQTKSEA